MDEATWLALAVVLTLLGGAATVMAWRRRGAASALRMAGVTTLVPAAYLTNTLELVGDIAVDVGGWARGLVLSPTVWFGVGLAGLAVVLIVLSGLLRNRGLGGTPRPKGGGAAEVPTTERPALGRPAPQPGKPVIDDDLDDIEAILKRRGIS